MLSCSIPVAAYLTFEANATVLTVILAWTQKSSSHQLSYDFFSCRNSPVPISVTMPPTGAQQAFETWCRNDASCSSQVRKHLLLALSLGQKLIESSERKKKLSIFIFASFTDEVQSTTLGRILRLLSSPQFLASTPPFLHCLAEHFDNVFCLRAGVRDLQACRCAVCCHKPLFLQQR